MHLCYIKENCCVYMCCAANAIFFYLCAFQDLSKDTSLMASNGAVVKALDLFSVCLAYLGDKAMECVNASGQRGKTYESRDVQWVVTVPAIWEPTAKEFMREAAYKVYHSLAYLADKMIIKTDNQTRIEQFSIE